MDVRGAMGSLRAARLVAAAIAIPLAGGVATGVAAAATVGDISGPGSPTNATTADFSIPVTPNPPPAGLVVTCQLDRRAAPSCDGGPPVWSVHYKELGEGPHTLTVIADDGVSTSSRVLKWVVDTTPPVTAIDDRPPGVSRSTLALFSFHSEPGATFTCTLDGVARPCVPPVSYFGLRPGSHLFSVAARDAAGNTDASPSAWAWAVSPNRAPAPSFVIDPERPRVGETVTLTSTATDADSAIAAQSWSVTGRGATLWRGRSSRTLGYARFSRVGTFLVRLTVTDALGAEATVTRAIRVRQLPAPPGSWQVQDAESVGPGGALLRVLRVRADHGAKIEVRCRGRRCPPRLRRYRATVGRGGTLRARRFERFFLAGAVIEVRVWDAGHLTKLVRIRLRADAAPTVRYGCEAPGRHAVRCAS